MSAPISAGQLSNAQLALYCAALARSAHEGYMDSRVITGDASTYLEWLNSKTAIPRPGSI
jgi:hypothetical protein